MLVDADSVSASNFSMKKAVFFLGIIFLLLGCSLIDGSDSSNPNDIEPEAKPLPTSAPIVEEIEVSVEDVEESIEISSTPIQIEEVSGPSGIFGNVFYASDSGGSGDQPAGEKLLIAIPNNWFASEDSSNTTGNDLRFLSILIENQVEGMTLLRSLPNGDFEFLVEPGKYVLCSAESEGSGEADFPIQTYGCGLVDVSENEMTLANISLGFGEILIEK